ncbi:MAG: hypothetical protein GX801_09545 [Fibrobacter sp.]|nr:hypothetical protein [Fibrobacter sp.]
MRYFLTFILIVSMSFASARCGNKRFSRELEYIMIDQCMGSVQLMTARDFNSKLSKCICLIEDLACDYGGSDRKLMNYYKKDRPVKASDKRYNRCNAMVSKIKLEEVKDAGESTVDSKLDAVESK